MNENSTKRVKIGEIKPNPNNPRLIKDDKFKNLVKSIQDFPEMLEIRPIVVNADMVILGGNMRFKACKEAGLKEVPVTIAKGLTPEQEREFIIKDNISGGEWNWELLAMEWEADKLEEWGLDLPDTDEEEPVNEEDNKMGIFPLSIVLNAFEYKQFQLYKKENGYRSDTEAFKDLFLAKEKTNEPD